MNKTTTAATLLLLLLTAATPAFAAPDREIELDYRRDSVKRPDSARPGGKAPPEDLRIEVDERAGDEPAAGQKRRGDKDYGDKRYGDRPRSEPDDSGLAAEARRAAAWTARELVRREGRPAAWRLGFYDGLHDAFDEPRLGRWDFRDGRERGRRAGDARRMGAGLGHDAAREIAERAAYEAVAAQFRDLSREPRPRPYAATPPFAAALDEAPAPRLEDVFRDLPLSGFARGFDVGPLPDPWQFYRYRGYRDFHDRRWWDADRAFDHWARRERSYWRGRSDDEKVYFKKVFRLEYLRQVSREYDGVAERAYRRGFDHGWDYGAHVVYEWHYRQGFHEGWHEALRESAEAAYRRAFPEIYDGAYGATFDEWSTSPRPEIRGVTVADGNDDGVFEPGEAIVVDYELVNYGGAAGVFDVRLDGRVLRRGASDRVDLPRRAVWRSRAPLETVIDAAVRPHTAAELDFSVAGLSERLALEISYPLELGRRVRLVAHDSLAGRAVIETVVRNASRRNVPGEIALATAATRRPPAPRFFAELAAGEERRVTFELVGLEPLDLLAGAVEVSLEARSGDRLHDELGYRLPELAVDLGDRGLLDFMTVLARQDPASQREVRRAQELMLRRLEADWHAVAARRGNDYKKDFKRGTRLTALGELVATYRAQRNTLRHREVFTALAPRIEELAKSMPGTHPFLRRSMKKLAKQLAR